MSAPNRPRAPQARSRWSRAVVFALVSGGCGSGEVAVVPAPIPAAVGFPVEALLHGTCGVALSDAPEVIPPATAEDVTRLELALTQGPDQDSLERIAAVARRRYHAWQRLVDDPDSGLDDEEREVLRTTSVGDVIREAQLDFALSYRTHAIHALGLAATPAARLALTRVSASSNPTLRHAAMLALATPKPIENIGSPGAVPRVTGDDDDPGL